MLTIVLIILLVVSITLKNTILKKKIEYEYYRDIPTNDSPAYVGKIIKGHIDGNDIVATILDLNYRGYIKIVTEKIKGKNKKVLYLDKEVKILDLKEYELFIINQIFKDNKRIIFDDYVKSKKFKKDFKTFDKMLEKRIEQKLIYKNSILKNISKIIFLVSFFTLGILIFYSMLMPIIVIILNFVSANKNIVILTNIIISTVLYIVIAYNYISYINKATSVQENINLNITYIILIILFGMLMIIGEINNALKILYAEQIWYKYMLDSLLAVIVLSYMFNIIKQDKQKEYLYYFFIIVSLLSVILNLEMIKCISIVFLSTDLFLKIPKNTKLKDNEYQYKWNCFKKYLEDYSMLSIQDENAILIWEKYLIYAVSLGINKKIIKKYSKLNNTALIDEQYLKRFYIEYLE